MWVQGTIVNICGSILVNLAANLLKLAHNVEENDKASTNKPESMIGFADVMKYSPFRHCSSSTHTSQVCSSKLYWRLGAFLFALGSVINFLSLSMAAQSLLATLGGVQFVSNIFFAGCILGEKVTRKSLIATAVIVIGLTVAVSFSDHASTRYTAAGLIALYDTTYVTFIVCVVASLLVAEGVYLLYTSREKMGKPLMYSSIVRPVTYSMVSATVGTQSVLQSKCLAELLRTDIVSDRPGNNDIFANELLYIVLTAFILGMAFWLYRLNSALKLFDGLVIIPIIQVFWVTSAVLQGGMFFKEFQEMSDKQSMLFTTGVATVFVGVYLIATSQQSEEENESDLMGNMDGDRDRLTDPEKGENCESDLSRRRVDGNVMIITCIGSPIKFERNRKLGNSNYSNCSSSRSSNFDGCDRYFEDFSAIEALNIDESPTEVELEVADSGISFSPVTIAHLATNSLKSPSRLSPPAIMNPLHLSEYNANPHGTSTLISSHLLSSGVSHELPSSPKLSFSVCVDSVPLAEGEELNHVKGSCTDVAPGRRLSHLDPLDGSAAENNSAS